ncbi:D-alanine-D-alanine ligase [Sinorhizobium terangae]|uniref:ATP-grasp domain-containing protein n=1 Tax=Sinorhizobium terangae TaxID=110322 RepID=A0A6N7LNW7_SINTE|nr:ATP-grasp domain-containing protein [Sinorhizobium terangae]MBB4188772.1 D-alanine-D-alanine ligase [Sinorhizobium terangae]MQX18918.1 ATP-grasp domain-containing protein [Sinorhizobium terangae]
MRVAVVWNDDRTGVVNRFGQSSPEAYDRDTVECVVAALQESGHEPLLCEADKGLLATLERFMPPDLQARPSGMVFNMTYGIQGECRLTHVPAMLEMAGVPYTGSSPLGHALALDKVITKRLIRDCGVPTPNFQVMRRSTDSIGALRFPLVVKPRHESSSFGLQLVHEPSQLREAVDLVVARYQQDALVEEYIEGREFCVALLGNEEPEVLPLLEQDFGDRETRLVTWEAKYIEAQELPLICPAQIESKLAKIVRDISVATFHACACRDYARVDLRVDRFGQPFVLEINSMPRLGTHGTYVLTATTAGYSFSNMINRILDVAHTRYFGIGIPKDENASR